MLLSLSANLLAVGLGLGVESGVAVGMDGESSYLPDDPIEAAVLATSDALAAKIEARLSNLLEVGALPA